MLLISNQGTDINLTWQGTLDWNYLFEISTDLKHWQSMDHPIEGEDGTMSQTFPKLGTRGFFRLFGASKSLDP
jgi:hypothetical protein